MLVFQKKNVNSEHEFGVCHSKSNLGLDNQRKKFELNKLIKLPIKTNQFIHIKPGNNRNNFTKHSRKIRQFYETIKTTQSQKKKHRNPKYGRLIISYCSTPLLSREKMCI